MSLLYDRFADLLRTVYDFRVCAPPVLDAGQRFPAHRRFLADWTVWRDEALAVAADLSGVPQFHELMASQADISTRDQRAWRMFALKVYGVPIAHNLQRCPRLAALLEDCPEVVSATLSFLAPWKHIPEHRGPFRGILRYYLALSVPQDADGQPATDLLIDGTVHRLADGQGLLWDDTYRHEVRHRSPLPRIALLLDVRRSGLSVDMAVLSHLLIALAGAVVRLRRCLPNDPFAAGPAGSPPT